MTDPAVRASNRPRRSGSGGQAGLPARLAAVALLIDVLEHREPLDAALSRQTARGALSGLAPRDRALARAIVATTLRRKGQIDALLKHLLERPLPKTAGPLRHILSAALAQILFMQMPPHAVVNLAVEQCRANRGSLRFDKLVNAVSRRAAREGAELISDQDAARLNTPDWLWQRWSKSYGEAATRRIAETHLAEPALDLSVKSDAAQWAQRLGGVALPTGSVRLRPRGRIEALEGFAEGEWWVQDAGSALPVRLLGDVAGKRIADLCAAPGGKTAQLAALGADVVAVDVSKARLRRLDQNLQRLKLSAQLVEADAANWKPAEPFDAVLLDVPCLATGTIRRHPDIAHLKRETELGPLTELQAALLANARTLVKPGGRLIYCTCSLEPEEGEGRIAKLLESDAAIRVEPVDPGELAGEAGWVTDKGFLRTLPFQCDTGDPLMAGIDGFFAARLRTA
jgi:16S rRNA (cytosine967-C5)-methyltransferase